MNTDEIAEAWRHPKGLTPTGTPIAIQVLCEHVAQILNERDTFKARIAELEAELAEWKTQWGVADENAEYYKNKVRQLEADPVRA